jgi:hypothetical protein
MLTASAWASQNQLNNKPWLILGKGPSFRKFAGVDIAKLHVLALNHVVREVKCDAALMMDFDVFDSCRRAILENARFVLLPWRPHFNFRPSARTLEDLVRDDADLAKLAHENRLVVFNALTGRDFPPLAGEPITSIKFFSAEAALNILADNGVRRIRTLGVDGGASYAGAFSDLNDKTLLANGREDFDKQFGQFNQTLRRHPELLFGPLNIETPVRIFIGSDPTQALGARIFEYSVRRFASMSTSFEVIDNEGLPEPADPLRRARTGFSFCRFKIPELCGWRGRSIYVDADMQVFTDIKDLWTRDFEDAWVLYSELAGSGGRTPQFSVMLLDCANLDWDAKDLITRLDAGEFDYKGLMGDFAMMPADKKKPLLEFEWNSLEHYEPARTKLVHFTDMPTQPWVSNANKHGEVWYAELRRAIEDGFVTRDDLFEEIERGHVSPLLPKWAKIGAYPEGEKLAGAWEPPYKRFARQVAGAR